MHLGQGEALEFLAMLPTLYIEGKTYEERLHWLKLRSLEERRNRQDLSEVLKMCNRLSRLG